MSCKGRGVKSTEFDYYPTPAWCVHRLLDYLSNEPSHVWAGEKLLESNHIILEPCAGDGAIIRACQEWGVAATEFVAFEIQERFRAALDEVTPASIICNSLETGGFQADWLITNPPFTLAQQFIQHFSHVPRSFWLLRINFLGTPDRREWLNDEKPNIYVLPNRPAFSLNKHGKLGTDGAEYAWFEFGVEAKGQIHYLDVTSKEEIKRAREEQLRLLEKWNGKKAA